MGIVMDTDMGIVMDIMQVEELDTGLDIMQAPGILHKVMCIKTGQMEFRIPEPDQPQDRAIQVQDLQHNRPIHQQETGRQPNREPGKTMFSLIKVGMFTRGTIAVVGSKETMDSGTILQEIVKTRGTVQAI